MPPSREYDSAKTDTPPQKPLLRVISQSLGAGVTEP